MNLSNLSVKQLQQAAAIKGQIERLQAKLSGLFGQPAKGAPKGRRKMSAAAKAKIAAAQRARWAKFKSAKKK